MMGFIKNIILLCLVILVVRVVDGDTLLLSTGEKVRLIGVDTPETVHPRKLVEYFGKETTSFTKRVVVEEKEVTQRLPTGLPFQGFCYPVV